MVIDHNDVSQSGALLYGYEYETSDGGTLQATVLRSVNNREVSVSVTNWTIPMTESRSESL